jgi:hypothetical protein
MNEAPAAVLYEQDDQRILLKAVYVDGASEPRYWIEFQGGAPGRFFAKSDLRVMSERLRHYAT